MQLSIKFSVNRKGSFVDKYYFPGKKAVKNSITKKFYMS